MNPHDRYFAAQRITLVPRTAPPEARLPIRRARPLRAFCAGLAVGAALAWLALPARAAPPLAPIGSINVCEAEALAARQMAEARDRGVPEARWHAAFDAARTRFDLPMTFEEITREHAAIAEVWRLSHLRPDQMFAFMLHRCLYGRVAS